MSEPQGWGQMKDTVLQICTGRGTSDTVLQICTGRGTSDTVEQAQCS